MMLPPPCFIDQIVLCVLKPHLFSSTNSTDYNDQTACFRFFFLSEINSPKSDENLKTSLFFHVGLEAGASSLQDSFLGHHDVGPSWDHYLLSQRQPVFNIIISVKSFCVINHVLHYPAPRAPPSFQSAPRLQLRLALDWYFR